MSRLNLNLVLVALLYFFSFPSVAGWGTGHRTTLSPALMVSLQRDCVMRLGHGTFFTTTLTPYGNLIVTDITDCLQDVPNGWQNISAALTLEPVCVVFTPHLLSDDFMEISSQISQKHNV